MNLLYRILRLAWKFIFFQTMRIHCINPDVIDRPGGYVLAVTHLSHLEVVCVGVMARRQIHWISRKEFYTHWLSRLLLNLLGCIKVDRQGVSVSSIRSAIEHVREGKIVGIFPEGGVVRGDELVIRGGAIKRGMCSIAIRGGVPIVPVVVLGVDRLNCVGPWLPFKRAKVWIAYGEPIYPPDGTRSTRQTREQLADRARASYQDLYAQLQRKFGVRDCDVP